MSAVSGAGKQVKSGTCQNEETRMGLWLSILTSECLEAMEDKRSCETIRLVTDQAVVFLPPLRS